MQIVISLRLHFYAALCFIHILLLSCFCPTKSYAKASRNYNSLVQQAELNIIQRKYKRALNIYQQAFTIRQIGKDLVNASSCAFYEGQYDLGKSFLSLYFEKGGRFFLTDTALHKFFPSLPSSVTDIIRKNRQTYRSQKLSRARLLIDSLFAEDQYYHLNRDRLGRDSMLSHDKLAYSCFMEFIKTNGFPEEKECVLDTMSLAGHKYETLIRHYIQEKIFTLQDLEFFKNLVLEDKFDPSIYAQMETLFFRKDLYGNEKVMAQFVPGESRNIYPPILVLIPVSADDIKSYNKKRMEIGLSLFEDFIKCIKMVLSDTPFFFTNTINGEPLTIEEYKQVANKQ